VGTSAHTQQCKQDGMQDPLGYSLGYTWSHINCNFNTILACYI